MTGCTNPRASNFEPSADQDDGSCVYQHEVQGVRHVFQDHAKESDHSFTISYSLEGNSWVFYHDYIPDFYFATRQQLYTLKNNSLWKHNSGPRGRYYNTTEKSFYIDVVFSFNEEIFLNSIQWTSTIKQASNSRTITHLTIWNDDQCSDRLELKPDQLVFLSGLARSKSEYSFNDFRDKTSTDASEFLSDIFKDFLPDKSQLDEDLPWYEQAYLQNRHFIIRLEFDNSEDREISIHEVGITGDQTYK